MRTISDLEKLLGVTRRALQGYNEIGLLSPSSKTEGGGYWLYDDAAVDRLIMIQLFYAAGYKRKEIKSILESSQLDMRKALDVAIARLKERQKRINGWIAFMEQSKQVAELMSSIPEQVKETIESLINNQLFAGNNLKDIVLKYVDESSDDTADEETALFDQLYYQFIKLILIIPSLRNVESDNTQVATAIEKLFLQYLDLLQTEIGSYEELGDIEELCFELMPQIFGDPELRSWLSSIFNDETPDFILNVIQDFGKERVLNLRKQLKGE